MSLDYIKCQKNESTIKYSDARQKIRWNAILKKLWEQTLHLIHPNDGMKKIRIMSNGNMIM